MQSSSESIPETPTERHLFEELFRRHQSRLQAWCRRLTRDPAEAADLAQETCLKAWQRLDSFRGEAKFESWLCSIARNLHIDNIRTKTARPEVALGAGKFHAAASGDLSVALERQDAQRRVTEVMRQVLNEVECSVMVLHYSHEVPLVNITELLKLRNPSGAKAYVVSARRKLSRWRKKIRLNCDSHCPPKLQAATLIPDQSSWSHGRVAQVDRASAF